MITMMVLLCYVNLSGMSLECIVIVLTNNSLLGGQFCTDSVGVQQRGNHVIGRDKLAIIPRFNFTCNGRITSIKAGLLLNTNGHDYPSFQMWRLRPRNHKTYKIGEVQLKSNDPIKSNGGRGRRWTAKITLTGNNTIEIQSGDVVGYYHPPDVRYRVVTINTEGYILYQFNGPHEIVILSKNNGTDNNRQPLIQFTFGK